GFQFALPPIELAFLHAALPAKFPNRHPAPRCFPNRPLPIPLLLDIVILPVHPTPPPFRDTLSRAGHYCCLRFKGGRCVGRTGTPDLTQASASNRVYSKCVSVNDVLCGHFCLCPQRGIVAT